MKYKCKLCGGIYSEIEDAIDCCNPEFVHNYSCECQDCRGKIVSVEELMSSYELPEDERKIRKIVENVLSNSHVVVTQASQGGRATVPLQDNEETIKTLSVAVKSAMEGFDWEHGKIILKTKTPIYTGMECEENKRRADVFSKIYSRYLAEKRDGKSSGFAEFVRGLMKEYEKKEA